MKRFVIYCLLVSMVFGLVGCGQQAAPAPKPAETKPATPPAPKWPSRITIGTASIGGVYYPVGMATAAVINKSITEVKAVAIATAGAPQNLEMMRTKELEIGVVGCLEGYRAIRGEAPYKEKMPWIRVLTGPLYNSGAQVVALKNRGIKSVYDFKGKKIAVGTAGSGGEVDARDMCTAHGLNYWDRKDLSPQYVDAAQAVDMLEDGLIDGAILGLTVGAAAIQELMLTGKVILLPIDDKAFAEFKKLDEFSVRATIPKNTYQNQDYDVLTVGSPPTILACREDLPDDLVYAITKALYTNIDEMKRSAMVMQQFDPKTIGDQAWIPYHNGTIKYFKEKGWIK